MQQGGKINVKATGTTTARTMSDWLADVINVKAFESLVVDGNWTTVTVFWEASV